MITEADARVLEYGSTIVLVAGGHITPLAHDTLAARRISVVRDGVDPDGAALAPAAPIRTVAIAGDHTSLGASLPSFAVTFALATVVSSLERRRSVPAAGA